MKADYKFHEIHTNRYGAVESVVVRFYEGDVTTENETVDGRSVPVTRYRRTSFLNTVNIRMTRQLTFEGLQGLLNDRLKADYPTRTPIDQQDNTKPELRR
jgi:hypothetical protein